MSHGTRNVLQNGQFRKFSLIFGILQKHPESPLLGGPRPHKSHPEGRLLKTISPDGVTNPRSQLFHVKMWKKVENAEKCGKMHGNVRKLLKNMRNVRKMWRM